MSSRMFLGTYLILYSQHRTQKRPIMTYFCYWIANDFALIMIYLLTCKIFLYKSPKIFFVFHGGWTLLCPQLKIYDRICSICWTADITVIQISNLSKLRSTFDIKCRNSRGWNGGQTSRSSKFFDEIQKCI